MPAPLSPRPGFNPQMVAWEGPHETPGDRCSYCGDDISDDAIPLVMWNPEGWTARFCDHCQARWFGIETFPEEPDDDDDAPDLGPCCMCERAEGVHCIIMLDRRCAVPGHGWGCVVCDLPSDGAVAVLCTGCAQIYETDQDKLTVACRGYPASDGRIPIAELPPGEFEHNTAAHADLDLA